MVPNKYCDGKIILVSSFIFHLGSENSLSKKMQNIEVQKKISDEKNVW